MRVPRRCFTFGRIAPLALVALAMPLLAPTCDPAPTGVKAFAKGSLIIPMDQCYQYDGTSTSNLAACPSTRDRGDVIKAYGLVYQLVRAGIPVYWTIKSGKASLTDIDATVQLSGLPANKYDWGSGQFTGTVAAGSGGVVNYRGGPFVVDASDVDDSTRFTDAKRVLASLKGTFGAATAVNLHQANVAFTANVAKTMSGGWNAGGTVAPKLALLNIPGGDGRYADHVLEGYLIKSSLAPACVLNNPPCADNSAGTATGTHGTIYDRLEATDFMPPACTAATATTACSAGSACLLDSSSPSSPAACGPGGTSCHCDWKSTNLFRGGYSVLWLPHWTGPDSSEGTLGSGYQCCDSGASGVTCTGSCKNAGGDQCSCVTSGGAKLSDAELTLVLKTIGAYSTGGNDVFGECGGIGSLEGIYGNSGASSGGVNTTFGDGDPATQFMATKGLHYNEQSNGSVAYNAGYYGSPFMQIGDFVYTPASGLIDKYRPAADSGSAFRSGVTSLITDTTKTGTLQVDYFTMLAGTGTHGNVVYLAGHDYSGSQGTFSAAGTRLVLNTLFNLGAKCIPGGACKVPGLFGVCANSQWTCEAGQRVCKQSVFPGSEVCDGLDNDCDGTVDDGLSDTFYDGPDGTKDVGVCHGGVKECKFADAKDGSGNPVPAGTLVPLAITSPEVTPSPEQCNGLDDDCNGAVDDGVQARGCYDLPGNGCTKQQDGSYSCTGTCKAGTQVCANGAYGACQGEVLPGRDLCEPETDGNCNGTLAEGCACDPNAKQTRPCYSKQSGTPGVGVCKFGHQDCIGQGVWTVCQDDVGPQAVACPSPAGADNDCDGKPDDCECVEGQTQPCYSGDPADLAHPDVTCARGTQTCVSGKWGACAGEVKPAPQELCDGKDNDCNGLVDDGATCALGRVCVNGTCTFGTCGVESPCGEGYVCQSAKCVAAECGSGGPCAPGKICSGGQCVDPCASVVCGKGAFCSGGTCVGGGCFATGCATGELCLDGSTCQKDPCANVACPVGAFCRAGDCVPSCAFVACAVGERCGADGRCAPDACAGVTCGAGEVCSAGQCKADECANVTCGEGQVCRGGVCGANACAGVVCPVGHCLDGQCYSSKSPQGFGVAPPAPTPTPTPSAPASKAGGGCASGGSAAPTALLLVLIALAFRRGPRLALARVAAALRHDRAGRTSALLAVPLAGVLLLGAGCNSGKAKSADPDPVVCDQKCGTTCVDLAFDAKNCGAWGAACGADLTCVDAKCGPSSPIGPFVATLSPPAASRAGAGLTTVDVAGARFQAGASVRAAGLASPAVPVALVEYVDDGHLRLQLDLRGASVGPLEIRVVNPDRVVSNAAAFSVLVEQPVIAGLAPPSVPAGQAMSGPVRVTGSGFVSTSQCRLSGPSLPEEGLVTTVVTAGSALDCTVDAVHLAPGDYALTVVSDGDARSTPATFSVVSPVPTLTSIEPPFGRPGTKQNAASITGSGFDATSDVQLLDGAGAVVHTFPTTYLLPTQLYVAELDLTSDLPGAYQVRVVNAGGAIASTNQLPFTVTSYPPIVNSTNPSAIRKDSTVKLAVLGANLDASSKIQLLECASGCPASSPPGPWHDVATTFVNTGELDAMGLSFVGKAPGSYLVRVMSGDANVGASAAMSIAVVSDTALLASLTSPNPPVVTPEDGTGALNVAVQVTGANLEDTAQLVITGPGLAATVLTATTVATSTSPQTIHATFSKSSGINTGTYAITAKNNANADLSNAVYLSVLPGTPSLTSLSASCVPQGATVTVNATGVNFALPDVAGNGGSVVHASFTLTGATAATELDIPSCADTTRRGNTCATVTDSAHLQITFDSTEAVIARYDLKVRNPGTKPGTALPNESGTQQLDVKATCP